MKKLLSLIFLVLFFCSESKAQEGIPVFFDYLADNYYLVYPSMAGIGEGGKLRLTARQNWFDVDNAPNLQTINANYRVGKNSGVGGIIFNDANGFHSQTGVKGTYAHHLKLAGDFRTLNQLSFGLSVTYLFSSLDETEFRSAIPDPIVTGQNITESYFNIDLGLSYNYLEFYAHFTVINALESSRNLYLVGRNDPDNVPVIDNLRRYLVSAGYVFGQGDTRIEPSFLFQLTEFTDEQTVDINLKAYRDLENATVWGGLSYRRSFDGAQFVDAGIFEERRLQLFTPIVGVNLKNYVFSYNYSAQSGAIRFDNGGFHQITIGYNIGQSNEKRFNCFCPASNNQ